MTADNTPNVMFIFPGQGSQYVGMGSDIYKEFSSARQIYARASGALGYDVAKLSFEGPREQLDKTEFTQPALLTHSVACLETFKELTDGQWTPAVVAGHSLGEYSALVAADSLTFEDAVKLVQQRGILMSTYGRGKMAAFRLDLESIKSIADAYYCGIGGCNLPNQTVVCGFKEDLEALSEEVVKIYGKSKAGYFLNTEGAFHTYLMINAAERFRQHLDATTVRPPKLKVLSNYTGDYHVFDPAKIKASLFFQMFHPVKWMWGLERAIADGVNTIVELGGGIGKDQPGEAQNPAYRKPNLEGITRKSQRGSGREGLYLPAINSATLRRTSRIFHTLKHLTDLSPGHGQEGDGIHIDDKVFRLYVPVRDGIPSLEALDSSIQVQEMGLDNFVQIIGESYDQNIRMLQSCCDADITNAESYLEVLIDGTTGAVLHYHGEQIARELSELRNTLQQRGHDLLAESQ